MIRENRLRRGIPLFKNPLLDWGSRVHPVLPALFWGPISLSAVGWGLSSGVSLLPGLGLFAAGYSSWLIAEYLIHRWCFHFRPRAKWLRRLWYLVHEHHHRYQEFDRLLAPPLLSLSIGAIALGLIYLLIGRRFGLERMGVFVGGFGIGYLVYDYTHLYIHFAKPTSRWGQYLRRCHLEHHFARPDNWFCISFPWLDFLFGTNSQKQKSTLADDSFWEDEDSLPRIVRDYEATHPLNTHPSIDASPPSATFPKSL